MRMLLIAAAGLSLVGCTTLAEFDAAVARNLPSICRGYDAAYNGYVFFTLARPVSATTARRVEAARGVLEPLCANPAQATSATVLTAAIAAYATIKAARDEARG